MGPVITNRIKKNQHTEVLHLILDLLVKNLPLKAAQNMTVNASILRLAVCINDILNKA